MKHEFKITVETSGSRKTAEMALLSAFASRQPDGCSFHLQRSKPRVEKAWKPISTAPREEEIIVKAKGFAWLARWSIRFHSWRTAEGRIIEGVTHWTHVPKV